MLSAHTASLEEVAAAIGRDPAWLMRNWRRLNRTKGFPRKIPAGDVWPRGAVEVWLRSAGVDQPRPLPANDDAADVDHVALASAALAARYGARP